jgi:hypothetical protein
LYVCFVNRKISHLYIFIFLTVPEIHDIDHNDNITSDLWADINDYQELDIDGDEDAEIDDVPVDDSGMHC